MKKANKASQRIIGTALLVIGIAFCIAAFLGHESAYSVAACFFAANLIWNVPKRKN